MDVTLSTDAVDRLRDERFTGPRRCWKCTVGNVLLLAALSILLGFVWMPVAAVLAIVGAAHIWLRGYLVPATPQITRRLFGTGFEKESTASRPDAHTDTSLDSLTGSTYTEEELVDLLVGAGVLVEADSDVQLAPSFEDVLWEHISDSRARSPDELAARVDDHFDSVVDAWPEQLREQTWVVASTGADHLRDEHWIRTPIVVADLAIIETLSALEPSLTTAEAAAVAPAVRLLFDRCPVCEETLRVSTVGSCCGDASSMFNPPDLALHCPTCSIPFARIPSESDEES